MKAISQVLNPEATSAWRYFVYLGSRILGMASIAGIVADLWLGGVAIIPEVYALLLLVCVGLGWVEMRDRTSEERSNHQEPTRAPAAPTDAHVAPSGQIRTGIKIAGGSTKLRGATIANMDVAFQADHADVDLNDIDIR